MGINFSKEEYNLIQLSKEEYNLIQRMSICKILITKKELIEYLKGLSDDAVVEFHIIKNEEGEYALTLSNKFIKQKTTWEFVPVTPRKGLKND